MNAIPRPGEIYQHFKGNLYRIVAVAEHTETGEQLVIYQALYGSYQVYARPVEMFMEKVDRSKYPQDQYPQLQAEYRFTKLSLVDIAEDTGCKDSMGCEAESAGEIPKESSPEISSVKTEAVLEEDCIDPLLLAFLDADGYERKLEIFDSLHMRIDQSMLNTIAISMDLEIPDGNLEEQYQTLRNCMLTLEKYECNRLR